MIQWLGLLLTDQILPSQGSQIPQAAQCSKTNNKSVTNVDYWWNDMCGLGLEGIFEVFLYFWHVPCQVTDLLK